MKTIDLTSIACRVQRGLGAGAMALAFGLLATVGTLAPDRAAHAQAAEQVPAPAAPATAAAPAASPAASTSTPVPGAAGPTVARAADGSVDVDKLMAEGALPDIVIGDPKAPVTIVEYASMTCGHCADFHENSYPVLKKDYLDTGKAKLILREFPFDPRAVAAFMLARCAPEGKRTAMVDVLFAQQAQWARAENASAALLSIARLAGFTQESFVACLNDKELQKKVVATQQRGEKEFGVNATPTFFINGKRYAGAMPAAEMAGIIDSTK